MYCLRCGNPLQEKACSRCGHGIENGKSVVSLFELNTTQINSEMAELLFDTEPDHFRIKGDVLEKYTGDSAYVAVPGNIRILDRHCFAQKAGVKKVRIPASVEYIGKDEDDDNNGAFWACFDLEELFFEENSRLKAIGRLSFYQCTKLHTISGLPDKIQRINSYAFTDCPLNKETIQTIKKITLELADDWNK